MKKNPFLKLEDKLIKVLYNNEAVIHFVLKKRIYNSETGEFTEGETVYKSKIYIDTPAKFSYLLVDGKNVMENDLRCHVSRAGLESAIKTCSESGNDMLFQKRQKMDGSGYIDTSVDMLEFCGIKYRIRQVSPKDVYAKTASKYVLHLRGIE